MELKTPLSQLPGIGPGILFKLKRLNLNTVEDLIYHFPFRYDDFSNTTSALEAKMGEKVTLQGEIWSIQNIYTRSRKIITKAVFNDGSSPIELTWFNSSWLTRQIQTGDRLQISGKISKYKNKLSIIAPQWEKITTDSLTHRSTDPQNLHTGRLVPIYPETDGISSKWMRAKIAKILPQVINQMQDPLPDQVRNKMLPLSEALQKIHFPQNWQQAEQARERLGFDELFYMSLATQKTRLEWDKKPLLEPLKTNPKDIKNFISKLPFELTSAQEKVLDEIFQDLRKNQPMNRLIQGEVGSGKTVVAATVAYLIHKNNLRTLFMAPTEILAFQHFETLKKLLEPFGISIGIYTGSKKSVFNAVTLSKTKGINPELDSSATPQNDNIKIPDIIVGTHALLSNKLATGDIGLVIVDEQQRFGVAQRTLLRSKAKIPHFLTMTATPIPRTVALTLYGDLDISIIDELPKGRQRVKTYLVPEKRRADSYKFIGKAVAEGEQIYIITPLIEVSETLTSVKAAKEEFEKLKKIFPDLNLGLLHGRMKGAEKNAAIEDFRSVKTHILVSTSVVEVGMDNPNATIIVIEGAERFGLAQLHQLRGRVGRGEKQSFCFLYTSNYSSDERRRLKYLETTFDGLKLAELDLKIRGSGAIFGTAQSGRFEFKIASFSNITLLEKTKKTAGNILAKDPTLDKYPAIKAKLQEIASGVMPD